MPVNLLSHPVVQSKISILRQTDQSSAQFRAGIAALSTCVGYEASKGLELRDVPDVRFGPNLIKSERKGRGGRDEGRIDRVGPTARFADALMDSLLVWVIAQEPDGFVYWKGCHFQDRSGAYVCKVLKGTRRSLPALIYRSSFLPLVRTSVVWDSLRAGLGMEGALLELFPDAPVYRTCSSPVLSLSLIARSSCPLSRLLSTRTDPPSPS
jgi:hypothetical protein